MGEICIFHHPKCQSLYTKFKDISKYFYLLFLFTGVDSNATMVSLFAKARVRIEGGIKAYRIVIMNVNPS